MKREAGVSPARTRRCNVGVLFHYVTGYAGKTEEDVDHKVRRPAYDGTVRTTSNWLVHDRRNSFDFLCFMMYLQPFACMSKRFFYLPFAKTKKRRKKYEKKEKSIRSNDPYHFGGGYGTTL